MPKEARSLARRCSPSGQAARRARQLAKWWRLARGRRGPSRCRRGRPEAASPEPVAPAWAVRRLGRLWAGRQGRARDISDHGNLPGRVERPPGAGVLPTGRVAVLNTIGRTNAASYGRQLRGATSAPHGGLATGGCWLPAHNCVPARGQEPLYMHRPHPGACARPPGAHLGVLARGASHATLAFYYFLNIAWVAVRTRTGAFTAHGVPGNAGHGRCGHQVVIEV